jgi:hypothetical protein
MAAATLVLDLERPVNLPRSKGISAPRCPRERTWGRESARWLGGVRSRCRGSGLIGVPARPAPKRVE